MRALRRRPGRTRATAAGAGRAARSPARSARAACSSRRSGRGSGRGAADSAGHADEGQARRARPEAAPRAAAARPPACAGAAQQPARSRKAATGRRPAGPDVRPARAGGQGGDARPSTTRSRGPRARDGAAGPSTVVSTSRPAASTTRSARWMTRWASDRGTSGRIVEVQRAVHDRVRDRGAASPRGRGRRGGWPRPCAERDGPRPARTRSVEEHRGRARAARPR